MAHVDGEMQVLGRILEGSQRHLTRQVARYFLGIGFDAEDSRRLQELNERNQAGILTADESEELNAYRRVGLKIDLFHSFARRRLEGADQ